MLESVYVLIICHGCMMPPLVEFLLTSPFIMDFVKPTLLLLPALNIICPSMKCRGSHCQVVSAPDF